MIYSEDAPALENALHREFEAQRVNKINRRREYFRITLEEITAAVGRLHGTITYVMDPKADEFRQTLAMASDEMAADKMAEGNVAEGVE